MAIAIGIAVFVLAAAALFAVAWWSSGRSRYVEPGSGGADLRESQNRALRHYQPKTPPAPPGGGGPSSF